MESWSTENMTRFKFGFQLEVPITCTERIPDGEEILHDCQGPPVRGLQDGESCYVRCKEGYFGNSETFTCSPSGAFEGLNAMCYRIDSIIFFAQLTAIVIFFASWACQYRFW